MKVNLSHLTPATITELKTLKGVIYLIYDRKRDMGYVGQSHLSFWKRYVSGKWWKYTSNPILVHTDGDPSRYTIYILEHGKTKRELGRLESYYIGALKTLHPHGFNFTLGEENPGPLLEPTKQLISERNSLTYTIYKDGQPIHVKGMMQFCKKHEITPTAMYNMLNGRTKSCSGYTRTPHELASPRLASILVLSHSTHGKHTTTNLNDFCLQWGLNENSMRGLLTDYVSTCHGWSLIKTESNLVRRREPSKASRYNKIVIQKVSDGSKHTFSKLSDIATLVDKHVSTVNAWLLGKPTSIKDWIVISIEKVRRKPWEYTPRERRNMLHPTPADLVRHST